MATVHIINNNMVIFERAGYTYIALISPTIITAYVSFWVLGKSNIDGAYNEQ